MKSIKKSLLILGILSGVVISVFSDTTTTRWGLTKPDVGSTSWGPKINTNYDTIDNAGGLAILNTWTNTNYFTGAVTTSGAVTISTGAASVFTVSTRTFIIDGTAAAPAIQFSNSASGLGIYRRAANSMGLVANGVEYAEVNTGGLEVMSGQLYFADTSVNGIQGTTTNNTAAAGNVGERVSSTTAGNFVNFPTSGQYGDLAAITITAGDWDIFVQFQSRANGATVTFNQMGVGTVSGNSGTGILEGDNACTFLVPTATQDSSASVAAYRVSSAGTYYLKYTANYSVATPKASGRITARRVR